MRIKDHNTTFNDMSEKHIAVLNEIIKKAIRLFLYYNEEMKSFNIALNSSSFSIIGA